MAAILLGKNQGNRLGLRKAESDSSVDWWERNIFSVNRSERIFGPFFKGVLEV